MIQTWSLKTLCNFYLIYNYKTSKMIYDFFLNTTYISASAFRVRAYVSRCMICNTPEAYVMHLA